MKRYLILLLINAALLSCSPLKRVPEGEELLVKNKVLVDGAKTGNSYDYIRQSPNRKAIFFRFYLQLYNLAGKKDNKFNNGLRRVGEAPVLYDSTSAARSAIQIERYFKSIGYFNAKCEYEASKSAFRRKRTKTVSYKVEPGIQYTIKTVNVEAESIPIKSTLVVVKNNSLVKVGDPYDSEVLDEERQRITTYLRGKGYFFFSKDHVFFEVDSSLGSHQVNILIRIQNIRYRSGDTILQQEHHPYLINKIVIQPNYNPRRPGSPTPDTLQYGDYTIVYNKKLGISPRAISDAIHLSPGQWYHYKLVDDTYNHLTSLQSFRSVNIQFEKDSSQTQNLLNTKIRLSPVKKWSYGIETEGTNEVGNLGVNGKLVFKNKNVFGGLEQMSFSIRGALESQNSVQGASDGFFNTSEFGAEVNLRVPRFLLPFNTEGLFSKRNQPFSNINLSVVREIRTDFTRLASSGSFGYIWNENVAKTHIIDAISITSVRLDSKPGFTLSENPFLASAFKNQLITSFRYSYVFNSQKYPKQKNKTINTYFKAGGEMSGILPNAFKTEINLEQNTEGKYQINGLAFSHFLRVDLDGRIYIKQGPSNQFAFRGFVGFGHVLVNSDVLPLEKQFFAGGSSDIRAFTAYQLGPGSFESESVKFNTGDVKLTLSGEYRFKVFKSIYSALFIDAGNIWTGNRKEAPVGTTFDIGSFQEQMAIGGGIGLRYDFTFFIIRLDLAAPFRDPSNTENPWVLTSYQLKDTKFNIGLGYPF